jgi:xanthine dehydrogenase accessory factor
MFENLYAKLISKVKEGSRCVLLTYLYSDGDKNGSFSEKILLTVDDIGKNPFPFQEDLLDKIHLCINTGKLQIANIDKIRSVLIEPFAPKKRLIVFGGGHISKPLVEFASRTGFSVTVIDDRPFFANSERFPAAEKILCESFEKAFGLIDITASDFVVILTRGHRYDGVVLREILKHEPAYIGMIGSKRRVKGMLEELSAEGFPENKLNSIHSPVGLDIGAVTPDEIAISIAAQLISCKNRSAFPELDMDVLEKASQAAAVPKALITILSSKGSVPRKAGARMLAYLDGTTIGTIGGGCSEAAVLSKARDIMRSRGFLIEDVDMTGDVAESEGMVCGGIMQVLIESC